MKFYLILLLLFNSLCATCCTIFIPKSEITNEDFYIDYTSALTKIFEKHHYTVINHFEGTSFESKYYITTGTNYFHLKKVTMEFNFTQDNNSIILKSTKNCYNVSCTASDYVSALKQNLNKLNKVINDCGLN